MLNKEARLKLPGLIGHIFSIRTTNPHHDAEIELAISKAMIAGLEIAKETPAIRARIQDKINELSTVNIQSTLL